MSLKNLSTGILLFSLTVLGAGAVRGQNYPSKPVRIVTFEVGGGIDFTARLIAQGLSASLGQQVIVDNRGSGVIPGQIVSRAIPDGYTLLVAANSLWIGSLLYTVPYDPVRDFSPISLATRSPNMLVVHPSVPVRSVKELIALTKARPGALNYGSASTGGSPHLAAELFKAMTGVNIVRVPYKGSAPALTALISGEVQVMFATAGSMVPHVKSGRLGALAVTSAEPFALFPGVPTVAETVPGYESIQMIGIFAPPRTPEAIIKRLNQESVRFLVTAKVKDQVLTSGVETVGSSPEEFASAVKSEMTRMGKVIKEAGIRGE